MAADRREIADRIITLMKSSGEFASLSGDQYIIGSLFRIPIATKKLMCEIQIETSVPEYRETGYVERHFLGQAIFTVLESSNLTFTSGVAVAEAQETAQDLAEAFLEVFETNLTNRTLNSLVTTNGARVQEILMREAITYMPLTRNDTYTAIATVPFAVRTQKVRS